MTLEHCAMAIGCDPSTISRKLSGKGGKAPFNVEEALILARMFRIETVTDMVRVFCPHLMDDAS